jgi:Uma2 family endonuclease
VTVGRSPSAAGSTGASGAASPAVAGDVANAHEVSDAPATLTAMSAQPVSSAPRFAMTDHPLTVAEYLAIGEVEPGYTELAEGRLELSPSPRFRHSRACSKLWSKLDEQLPPEFVAVEDIDVDLQLVPADQPGTVRRPDVIVAQRSANERVDREGEVYRASDVVIAIEVVSPGSRRLDRRTKRGEYADAGIPHYWIVDLDEPVSLVACHLAGELGYMDPGAATGVFCTTEPFPVAIDLDALLD